MFCLPLELIDKPIVQIFFIAANLLGIHSQTAFELELILSVLIIGMIQEFANVILQLPDSTFCNSENFLSLPLKHVLQICRYCRKKGS